MKQVFASPEAYEAHLVASVLENYDVPAIVQGEVLAAAAGGLSLFGLAVPGVWVIHDEDAARAMEIIRTRYVPPVLDRCPRCDHDLSDTDERRCPKCGEELRKPHPTWKCANCGKRVEEQFTECWKCGATRAGDL